MSPRRLQRVHGPSGVVLARRRRTTPARLPRESLRSCARSLPSYNTSTAPLGVAFVVLLQRPDGVFDVVSHACTCVKGGHVFGETGEVETVRRESSVFFSARLSVLGWHYNVCVRPASHSIVLRRGERER